MILDGYFDSGRFDAVPSPTAILLETLASGFDVRDVCGSCQGDGRMPCKAPAHPERQGANAPRRTRGCRRCKGKGYLIRRYDGHLELWREGVLEETKPCPECLGQTGKTDCAVCKGKGAVAGMTVRDQVITRHLGTLGDGTPFAPHPDYDAAIDLAWAFKRMPKPHQEAIAAWYSPAAQSLEPADRLDCLLPLTAHGRGAYAASRLGLPVDVLLKVAYQEASALFRDSHESALKAVESVIVARNGHVNVPGVPKD